MLTTLCNKEAMQQWRTPDQMTYEPTITKELNGWNLLRSLHDQMCHQTPCYRRHVVELLSYLIPYLITLLTIWCLTTN
jgi:hypothetical protein